MSGTQPLDHPETAQGQLVSDYGIGPTSPTDPVYTGPGVFVVTPDLAPRQVTATLRTACRIVGPESDEHTLGQPARVNVSDHSVAVDIHADEFNLFIGGINAASTPASQGPPPHQSLATLTNPVLLAADRKATWPKPTGLQEKYPTIADVYNVVRHTGLPNSQGARIILPTGLDIGYWHQIASGHPHDQPVLDGVSYGFNLQYCGPPLPSADGIVNHHSARAFSTQVTHYIDTEIKEGAMIGPFASAPFSWTHVSPMLTRQKSSPDVGARRVIVDLSFPPEKNVNLAIPHNLIYGLQYSHTLPTVDDLVHICHRADYRGFLYSVDISRAYRNFPVDPLDWPLMAITHNGHTLLDLAMPFGARSSSLHMQLVARFIMRHLAAHGATTLMYLDDLIGHAHSLPQAEKHYALVKDVMEALGLPLAVKKLTPPTRSITWLGITMDMDDKTLTIPPSKVEAILTDMRDLHEKQAMNRKDVQRLAGRINHLAKACRPARLFMARILAYLRGHPLGYTKVPQSVKADIRWFVKFLPAFNGISTIPHQAPDFTIEADSCLQGAGALGDGNCYMYSYPQQFADAHISQLEGINCMAAVRLLIGPTHRGMTVLVECDNSAAVCIFVTGKGREPVILACARAIWRHAAELDCHLLFKHKPGVLMEAADALSRVSVSANKKALARRIIRQRGLKVIPAHDEAFNYSLFI